MKNKNINTEMRGGFKENVSLIAGGDILIRQNLFNGFLTKGKSYIFSELKPYIQGADIAFANLETSLIKQGKKNPNKNSYEPFFKMDPLIASAIKDAGFNILCLANNHIMDYGENGLKQTIATLKKHNIPYVGAGMEITEVCHPFCTTIKGLKFAFLAYSGASPATVKTAGCAPLRINVIVRDINSVCKENDFVVISLHHGIEYSDYPVPEHMDLAHKLIENGADLV